MDEGAPRLEIFGDLPTTEDGLGFDDYADILLGMIGNFDARSPLTIGIHGRWGSGKTSLMRMVKTKLEDDEGVKTVWFNAWAYGRDESIGLALLQQILIEFQEEEGLKEKGKTLLGNVVKLGTDALLRKITMITLEEAKEIFENSIGIKSTLRHDFETVVDECLEDRRLVVFIDDLDRCLPEKTIEILEVIKLFLDVPKCIFVIGVEKEVIEKGIEVRYKNKEQKIPISGQDYIEKIIQVPFELPPIREDDMAAFIEKLGIGEREKGYVTIVAKGTGCNPRKVKLFLNVLRIRRAIAERTGGKIEPDLSAKLLVFERGFKEFYKDLVKYKDGDLLCELERLAKGDSDEELEGELKNSKLMRKYHEDEDLSILLRDKPFFCGIDIEPYIYLSGTEASQEVIVFDESVLNELLSGDYVKISHAANTINEMPDSEKQQFLNVVIPELKNEDKYVRVTAAVALGKMGYAGAVEELKEALKDEAEYVRRAAASALGAIGDPRAVGALKDALNDVDASVRGDAAGALGAIGAAGAVGALKDALKDAEEVVVVRKNAARALGAIGDPRAVEALEEALKDEDASVRRSVAVALGRISDAGAVEDLEDALKDEDALVRGFAAKALGAIGDPRAVGALKEALNDGDASVRMNAARALGGIGDSRAVGALIEALKYEDIDVRMAAAETLGSIGDSRAVEALEEALNGDVSVYVRMAAAEALGHIGDSRAVEALEEALKHEEDVNMVGYAAQALEQIKAKQNQ